MNAKRYLRSESIYFPKMRFGLCRLSQIDRQTSDLVLKSKFNPLDAAERSESQIAFVRIHDQRSDYGFCERTQGPFYFVAPLQHEALVGPSGQNVGDKPAELG